MRAQTSSQSVSKSFTGEGTRVFLTAIRTPPATSLLSFREIISKPESWDKTAESPCYQESARVVTGVLLLPFTKDIWRGPI